MVNSNYAAWQIDSRQFPASGTDMAKLQFFARYAILAPSGHNTQPWRLAQDQGSLQLKADLSRRLPYSGIAANEPFVSLGCFLGVMELAAEGFGYRLAINYAADQDLAATVSLSGRTDEKADLLQAIVNRVSNRNPYQTENLSAQLLDKIIANPYRSVSAEVIAKKADIEFISEQTTKATLITMGNSEFRAELSKWVRNNLTRQHDGMPGFVQGIPTPPSLMARHIIKHLNIAKDQARKDSRRILHSANLVIIFTKTTGRPALLDGGRLYSQICVRAEQAGIATAGIGAAVIEAETRSALIEKFTLTGNPIAIIRLGKSTKPAKHTPRWPLTAVTV